MAAEGNSPSAVPCASKPHIDHLSRFSLASACQRQGRIWRSLLTKVHEKHLFPGPSPKPGAGEKMPRGVWDWVAAYDFGTRGCGTVRRVGQDSFAGQAPREAASHQ